MVNTIIETAASLFQSIVTIWFIARFNRRRWFGDKLAILFSCVLFAITLLGDRFFPGFNVWGVIIPLSATMTYAFIICNKAYARAILSSCLVHTLIMVISVLCYAVVSTAVNDFETTIQGSDSITRYVYLVFANLCFFVFAKLVLSLFNIDNTLELKTGLIMFATSMLTMIGFGVTTDIAVRYQHDNIDGVIIALTCVFVAINVILYALVNQIQKLQRKKYELQLINEKLSFEESRINDATAILDTCRKMRHDMKQHLTVIGGYLDDGKENECRAYVKELTASADHIGNMLQSGNTVIDYLINAKLRGLTDTHVTISGNTGDLSDIKDVDLSCIIGNILDNAVEAVRPLEDKRIDLTFATQNSNRIIICRNTADGSVLKKNRFLASTKSDPEEHGLGHKIVANVVQSYDGMINYFEEDGMFGVQIVLPKKD